MFAQLGSRDFATGTFTLDVALPRGVRATAELPDGSTRLLSHGSHHLTAQMPNDGGSRHGADLTTAIG